MLRLRSAAALLQAAATADALAPLLAEVGFPAPPLPLDADARRALGLPDELREVRVARGPGALRALACEVDCGRRPLRECVARAAGRLAARAPQLLWLVAAAERGGSGLVVAAWSAERTPPRVVSLVVDRAGVVDSDAETLCALAAAAAGGGPDVMVHERWLDVLGRESLTRRFYRALERVVLELGAAGAGGGRATPEERKDVALLYVSRLLFLAFLEAKGWLDRDRAFLSRTFDRCLTTGGGYHRRVLLPLFFGTLNTPVARRAAAARAFGRVPFLNGGLFGRSPLERRARGLIFPDEALGRVFGDLLGRYRFTAREDSAAWSEAAVDPEMLGKAFESLMAARERRASGAFYTPQPLVERVTTAALTRALAPGVGEPAVVRALAGSAPAEPDVAESLRARAARLRLLDPACGSGAFLVHALERVAALLATLGDGRPTVEIRRQVLTRSIFGVDVNPTAVWLCELRLWLSVVIESDERDPLRVTPLPNLDRNVRVGDSLAGGDFGPAAASTAGGRAVARLRAAYARATGARKRQLARALDREERARALAALDSTIAAAAARRRELLSALRGRDLFGERHADRAALAAARELRERSRECRARRRALAGGGALPFAFAAHFADAAADGGFDVALGNPPWVRLHHVPPAARQALRREFRVFRDAAWEEGAARTGAGRGFAAQVDLAALFVERALALLRPGGTLALLVPVKLWRSLAGGGVRRLLAADAELLAVEDLSESRHAFDAAVYPSLVVARRGPLTPEGDHGGECVSVAVHRAAGVSAWLAPRAQLALDASPASPWLLLPPPARRAFDRLRLAGVALAEGPLDRPTLGVKCGCNEAFVVRIVGTPDDGPLARVADAAGRVAEVERALLRPLLRGEGVAPWRCTPPAESLLWTHGGGDDSRPLRRLPPYAQRWLAPWRARLSRRTDARGGAWWSLFRVDAARSGLPRVVWADIGRAPRAAVLPAGDPTVPLNSCYVVRCPALGDALALAALLNAPPAAAWLDALAEPARGGYRRYLGWTLSLLPVPADWPRARALLAPLGARGVAGERLTAEDLTAAALEAYGVAEGEVGALMEWGRKDGR
ncbi:MAG TPA: N-6 DNA methylase [Gemmatimonadaceae bacterium]|nr:N-6 DNA methylase [Gemmatimonadaceae bacterium]